MENIFFYGERGIVNGLVLDIKDDLSKLKKVLNSIEWCLEQDKGWINDIHSATYLVEPGFSKFGQPDLVIICESKDGSKYWFFIEAKAIPYHASAISNDKGMKQKAFNSSINGQISLNYRLALALENYSGESVLTESVDIFEQYQEKISDYNNVPRKAGKPELLRRIINRFMIGLKLEKTFFVAITRDPPPNPIKNCPQDLLPLLIDESGNNRWPDLSSQVGFLSLEVMDLEILNLDGYFRAGCRTHIGKWEENPKPNDFDDAPVLRPKNWDEFPDNWVDAVDELADCIKKNTSQWAETIRYNGSYSFKINNKTIGKLLLKDPHNPCLMVGFSIVVPDAKLYAEYFDKSEFLLMAPPKEPFTMSCINKIEKKDEICEVMTEFLQSFRLNV
jgi:hypothetical protein